MNIATHLLALAITMLAGVLTVCMGRQRVRRRFAVVLAAALPVLLVGIAVNLLLLVGRKPLLEWLIPLAAVLVSGCCCNDRVFRFWRIAAAPIAIALSYHFLLVANSGNATNAPAHLLQLSEQAAKAAVREAAKQAPRKAGPVGRVEVRRVVPLWHSNITGLWRVEREEATLYYDGEAVHIRRL